MKKIIILVAFIASAISAGAKALVIDNQLNCAMNITIYSHNSTCSPDNCYHYSYSTTVAANSTLNYTGPNDGSLGWTPSPCNMNFPNFVFSDIAGGNGTCSWTFDLGACTATTTYTNSCSACGGTVNVNLSSSPTTITVTIN